MNEKIICKECGNAFDGGFAPCGTCSECLLKKLTIKMLETFSDELFEKLAGLTDAGKTMLIFDKINKELGVK